MPKPERVPYFLSAREVLRRAPMNREAEKMEKFKQAQEFPRWVEQNFEDIFKLFQKKLLFTSLYLTKAIPQKYHERLKVEMQKRGYTVKTEQVFKIIHQPDITKKTFKVKKLTARPRHGFIEGLIPHRFDAEFIFDKMMEKRHEEATSMLHAFAKIAEAWDPITLPEKQIELSPEQKEVQACEIFKEIVEKEGYKTECDGEKIVISISENKND